MPSQLMQALWLYLHFPQLQLDTLLAQHTSQPRQNALIIVHEQKLHIVQLNAVAAAAGINVGMSLGAAAALLRDLDVVAHNPHIEADALTEIANNLYLVCSDICLFDSTGLLLRVHNMLHLYGGLHPYWLAVQQQLAVFRLTYQYATGTTPLAAKMLAVAGTNTVSADPQLLQQSLAAIPLVWSELDQKSVRKLNRVGVSKVAELLAIPATDMATRFSQEVSTYVGRLTGELVHPVNFYHPKANFARYIELLYEITNTQTLLPALMHLLNALERFLQLGDWVTQGIHIRLHQRDNDDLDMQVTAQQGEYRAQLWATLIQLQLENLQLCAPVYAITLRADKPCLRQPDKLDLFAGKQGQLSRLQLLSLLQAKLGEKAVFSPTFISDHRPEKCATYTRALAHQVTPSNLQALRPWFLLDPPQPLAYKVSIQYGPERIQTGWWDGHAIQRDYFIARSQQGQWYWIFRTPQQEWYVHGIFS